MSLVQLLDKKVVSILHILVANPKEQYHIQKLSTHSGVPLSSCFRITHKLTKISILKIVKIGKFKTYILNQEKISEIKPWL